MPAIIAISATIVLLIQNVLTRQYLTYNGSDAVMHSNIADPKNFHFSGKSSHEVKYIQVLSDDSIKLGVNTSTDGHLSPLESDTATPAVYGDAATDGSGDPQQSCEAKVSIGSAHDVWYMEPRAENIVRLFVMDGNGVKWYIRANFNGIAIDLVCEDYVHNIDNSSEGLFISKKELEFKLVPMDTLDL